MDGYELAANALVHERIVHGDGTSATSAAASIVAKGARDRLMACLGERYPGYGFERHKGYGRPEHVAAITKFGADVMSATAPAEAVAASTSVATTIAIATFVPDPLSVWRGAGSLPPLEPCFSSFGYGSTITVQVSVTAGAVGSSPVTVIEPSPPAPVLTLPAPQFITDAVPPGTIESTLNVTLV